MTLARMNGGNLADSTGSDVDFGSTDSVTARVGLTYVTKINSKGDSTYFSGNLTHVSADDASTDVAADVLTAEIDGNWLEIGAGSSFDLDDKKSLFAEASYKTGLGGNVSDTKEIGLKFDW